MTKIIINLLDVYNIFNMTFCLQKKKIKKILKNFKILKNEKIKKLM